MAEEINIDLSNPASLGKALQRLADELSIAQSVCTLLAVPVIAFLAERDIADGSAASLADIGSRRHYLLGRIREVQSKISDSVLLAQLEQLCT